MQRQLRDSIKTKYGVSSRTSNQVITALTEIEKHRQGKATGLPGRPGSEQNQSQSQSQSQSDQIPIIDTIIGGLDGSGSSSQRGGGLLGLIINFILSLFTRRGGSQAQGSNNVMNILTDLTGGATNPSQAPDLASILLGLLGGGSTAGSSGQAPDVEDLITSLMSGRSSKKSR